MIAVDMRIAHVTATFPPYQAGTGNVCYFNCRELTQRGHEVHVFTAAMDGIPDREVLEGFVVHRLNALLQIGNMPILPGLVPALREFDIIHLHYPFILGAEMVRLASALYGTPFVASFHNDLIGYGVRGQVFWLYQSVSAHLTMRRATRVCVLSLDHYQSSRLHRSLGDHLNLFELPNGVDLNYFFPAEDTNHTREKYGIPVNAKLVLFVGALDRAHHFKGLANLLQAIQTLAQNVWLLIVGDGDLRTNYEEQARTLGVSSRTVFVGSIQHKETPSFFRVADVTVLPSSPPESFGLVLIESLACGTPVIATRIPGVRTVVDHERDGLLVEPNSPIALAEAIQKILSDPILQQAMGQRGRAKVEARYSWERIGASLESIYYPILEHEN